MYTAYGGEVYVYTPLAYLKNGKQSKFHFLSTFSHTVVYPNESANCYTIINEMCI